MTREQLKFLYNTLLAAALGLGFLLGYTLKGRRLAGLDARLRPVRAYEAAFPGARSRYRALKRRYAGGPFVRTDFADLLGEAADAIAETPGYPPFRALRATIYEDLALNLAAGRIGVDRLGPVTALLRAEEARHAGGAGGSRQPRRMARVAARPADLGDGTGDRPAPDPRDPAERFRALARREWEAAAALPAARDVRRFGDQWSWICAQHASALAGRRHFTVGVLEGGYVDLTPAYNVRAVTRDHDRYPNDQAADPKGTTFEEKHMPEVLRCPRHPEAAFLLPCLPHLAVDASRTIREDFEFFRTAIAADNQALDLDPDLPAGALHLLACNVTEARRPVRMLVRVTYGGPEPEEKRYEILVGPRALSPALVADRALRERLDPAYRDSEMHRCDGTEMESFASPLYLYHVTVPLEDRPVDAVGFPRFDLATHGLEDPGIPEVRILALTLSARG